jgi:hypothetical protein
MDTRNLPRLGDVTKAQLQDALSLDYARWLSCLSETNIPTRASEVFLARYPHAFGSGIVKKALTPPGTTTDATWANPLLALKPFTDAFVAIAWSQSLLGRIPGLRTIPFQTKAPIQTGDAGYAWVKQGDPKPVSKLAFSDGLTLGPTKCVGIVVVTRELTKLSVPGSEAALRDTLIAGLTNFTDKSFLDPASTAIAETRPGSVTAGTTPISGTGNLAVDVQTLLTAFFAGAPNAIAPVLITNAAHGAAIRSMNAGGGVGLPIIVSAAAVSNVIAMDPNAVFVADDGVAIDISREASLQMNDAPDNPVAATTVFTSLWQQNLSGFRVERFVNWQALTGAVKYLIPS